jgi:hypothetical protein
MIFSPTRRSLLAAAPLLFAPAALRAQSPTPLLERAKAALDRHRGRLAAADRIAIADFSQASRLPRFHLVDLASGQSRSLLVAHGKGSDPDHCGWLERFSNAPGSEATSEGAYVTAGRYMGQHGASMRLQGLEPSNDQAEGRAIVVHAAWYVSPQIAAETGKLGRSQGCFAVNTAELAPLLDWLGEGRMIWAGRA